MKPNASYYDRLVKHYGTTDTPELGGFLLPTGEFLDFSEGSGSRSQDHRNITWVSPTFDTPKRERESRYDTMARIAKRVMMYRWMPENWYLETWTLPTAAQLDAIGQLAAHKAITIEAWGERGRHYSAEYEPWEADEAWRDLLAFYRGRDVRRNPPKRTLLFSYGSNGPDQLRDRLGYLPPIFPAYADDVRRVYRGYSRGWGGAVASLINRKGATTYGSVAKVRAEDLDVLDSYEGVHSGNYRRGNLDVMADFGSGFEAASAVVYVSTSKRWGKPTQQYLRAIAKNVGSFWQGSSGKPKPSDFYNED